MNFFYVPFVSFDRFFTKLDKQYFFGISTVNFLGSLALKQMLYGLTQIEEGPIKGIDSSA
jgi:hypothetical protein